MHVNGQVCIIVCLLLESGPLKDNNLLLLPVNSMTPLADMNRGLCCGAANLHFKSCTHGHFVLNSGGRLPLTRVCLSTADPALVWRNWC